MREVLTVPPTLEPITLALAKQYLKVTHKLEDLVIADMISAARQMCENTVQMAISPQAWQVTYRAPRFEGDEFGLTNRIVDPERIQTRATLPRGPITAVTSIKLANRVGVSNPFTEYTLDLNTGTIAWTRLFGLIHFEIDDWYPRPDEVIVDYTCGFPSWVSLNPGATKPATQPDVMIPADIRQAILIVIASLYENRGEDDTKFPQKALTILRPYYSSSRSAG